jgi:hypothetical protein
MFVEWYTLILVALVALIIGGVIGYLKGYTNGREAQTFEGPSTLSTDYPGIAPEKETSEDDTGNDGLGTADKIEDAENTGDDNTDSEEDTEEEEEEDLGSIHIVLINGKVLDISCDYPDDRDFENGTLTLKWNQCGVVTVKNSADPAQDTTYDTNEKSLELIYTEVAEIAIVNL